MACRLTHELIKAYDLAKHMRVWTCGVHWQPANAQELNRFHTDAYVHFLQQLTCNGCLVAEDSRNHVLNQSVCFSETAWCVAPHSPPGQPHTAQWLLARSRLLDAKNLLTRAPSLSRPPLFL